MLDYLKSRLRQQLKITHARHHLCQIYRGKSHLSLSLENSTNFVNDLTLSDLIRHPAIDDRQRNYYWAEKEVVRRCGSLLLLCHCLNEISLTNFASGGLCLPRITVLSTFT